MDLVGKVALVTGAATGLGRAIAEQLLIHGAKVSLCDLDSDAGELTSSELSRRFGADKVIFCHSDVTEGTEFEGWWTRKTGRTWLVIGFLLNDNHFLRRLPSSSQHLNIRRSLRDNDFRV